MGSLIQRFSKGQKRIDSWLKMGIRSNPSESMGISHHPARTIYIYILIYTCTCIYIYIHTWNKFKLMAKQINDVSSVLQRYPKSALWECHTMTTCRRRKQPAAWTPTGRKVCNVFPCFPATSMWFFPCLASWKRAETMRWSPTCKA